MLTAETSAARAAYHEAGHAVVALVSHVTVAYISTEDVWLPDALGCIETAVMFGQMECDALVLFSLAGGVAEQRHLGCSRTQLGDAGDLEAVRLVLGSDLMLEDTSQGRGCQRIPDDCPWLAAAVDLWRGRAERLFDQN